jgi:hypothetical protein
MEKQEDERELDYRNNLNVGEKETQETEDEREAYLQKQFEIMGREPSQKLTMKETLIYRNSAE